MSNPTNREIAERVLELNEAILEAVADCRNDHVEIVKLLAAVGQPQVGPWGGWPEDIWKIYFMRDTRWPDPGPVPFVMRSEKLGPNEDWKPGDPVIVRFFGGQAYHKDDHDEFWEFAEILLRPPGWEGG